MYCTKCGTNLPADARVCSSCGQPIAQPGASPNLPPSPHYQQPPAGYPPPNAPYGYAPYPYQPPLPSPYPEFGHRLVAFLIDSLIVNLVSLVVGLMAFVILGVDYFRHLPDSLDGPEPHFPVGLVVAFALWVLVMLVFRWLYHAIQESGPNHATVGKKMFGITVTDMQGQPLSFARASGRHFAKIISGMLPLAIGYIMAAFTEKRQALHDMIAGCLVMKKKQ